MNFLRLSEIIPKSRLSNSIIYSVIAQFMRYAAPLAFFPHLTRALGREEFGRFALIYAVAIVLGQVIEFGFGLSGVRALSEAREDPAEARNVVVDVIVGRGCIALIVLIGGLSYFLLTNQFAGFDWTAMSTIFLLALGFGFVPSWYFIGRDRALEYALMEAAATTTQLIGIFTIIDKGDPASLAVLVLTIPWIIVSVAGNIVAVVNLGFSIPRRLRTVESFHTSFRFFCFTSLPQILSRTHIFFLGILSTPAQVAYYAVGERIMYAAVNMVIPVTRVLLPKIVGLYGDDPSRAVELARRVCLILGILFVVAALSGAALSPWIIPWLFGHEIAPGVTIIAILMLTIPAMAVSRLTGTLILVPLHREKAFQRTMLVAGIAGILLAPLSVKIAAAFGLATWRIALELVTSLAIWRASRTSHDRGR